MVSFELTAEEAKALSACLNVAVKHLGICSETMHALAIHKKLEAIIKTFNEAVEAAADTARPN